MPQLKFKLNNVEYTVEASKQYTRDSIKGYRKLERISTNQEPLAKYWVLPDGNVVPTTAISFQFLDSKGTPQDKPVYPDSVVMYAPITMEAAELSPIEQNELVNFTTSAICFVSDCLQLPPGYYATRYNITLTARPMDAILWVRNTMEPALLLLGMFKAATFVNAQTHYDFFQIENSEDTDDELSMDF